MLTLEERTQELNLGVNVAFEQHDILHVCHQGYFCHRQHLPLYTVTCEHAEQVVWGLQHAWCSNSTRKCTLSLNFVEFLPAVTHTTLRHVCPTESIIYSFCIVWGILTTIGPTCPSVGCPDYSVGLQILINFHID